jgi:DNA-binding response OmpR family regulator
MDRAEFRALGGRVVLFSPTELVRDALAAWLRDAGYAVDACATEEEAASWLGTRAARVFVTTELLPRGTALPTLAALRERHPETAVLYIDEGPLRSAREALLPASFARVCGVDATVTWPFDRRAVMAAVETVATSAAGLPPANAPLTGAAG